MQLSAPALVRPRCYDLVTGDVVLLEDEVRDFVETHRSGAIEILGEQGAGKSTALEHLASIFLPAHALLLDDAPSERIAELAAEGVAIYTTRTVRAVQVDLYLRLAPWGDDELIEYLLAAHPAECGSVMQRLLAADDRQLIQGVPELCALVLEQMARDGEVPGTKLALRRALDAHLTDPNVRELAGAYAWALQIKDEYSAERQAVKLPAAGGSEFLLRALHWTIVQRLLAAAHVFEALMQGGPKGFLLCTWPRELVEETALLLIAAKGDVLKRLRRLADESPQPYQATAASLLHACGQAWRPATRQRARLTLAYLDGIAWPGVNLKAAHLTGTQLSLANLQDACLDDANAAGARFRGASLRGASLAAIDAPGADFSHADLSQVKARKANLFGATLIKARCDKASLIDADLGRADLTSAGFQGADLLRACLVDATIDDADFSDARLDAANLSDLPMHKACWDGARFAGAVLRGVNLEDVRLPEANFERATLVGAHLTGSRLPRANFRGADLRKTGLADIHWERADLRDADLRYCTFHMGSTRSGLLFTPYASEGSRMGFYTDEYEEQFFKRPEEIRKANLRGADLCGARIKDVDFYLVDLRGALYTPEQADHFRRCRAILE